MKNVLVIGGSGFVGTAVCSRLAGADFRLTVPTRRRERARHLAVLPAANVVEADVHDPATLARLMAGQDAVVSLVGILKGGEGQPYGEGFARAHVLLPLKIATAARTAGVRRVVHVSALGAAADAPSGYLRSKAAGETALRSAGPGLTVLRPSVIFGRGDSFLTLFAQLAAVAPLLPLACAGARFAPVWVGDVAGCVQQSLRRPAAVGATYPLCGPREYSLRELVDYAATAAGHRRPILGLPLPLAWLQAWLMEFVPDGPLTRDNIRSMQVPSVCGCPLPFGIEATPLEAVAPDYLHA